MASPFRNGQAITLLQADSPFVNVVNAAPPVRFQTVAVTALSTGPVTLTLYAGSTTSSSALEVLTLVASTNSTVYIPFAIYHETQQQFIKTNVSATLSGAGGKAYLFLG
jgi:hypothetical protein